MDLEAVGQRWNFYGNRVSTLLDLKHGQLMLGPMHKVNFYIQQLLAMFWVIYMIWIRMTIKPEAG